jgi:hypothetical protein
MPNAREFIAACAVLLGTAAFTASAPAVTIEHEDVEPNGQVVMSPAAERIETTEADGGPAIAPGDTVHRSIILRNQTTDTTTSTLSVAGVTGSSNPALVVDIDHETPTGAANWATVEVPRIVLRPGDVGTVDVEIKIPKDAAPGSHPFGIAAQHDLKSAEVYRQVAIFIVEVPGDVKRAVRFGDLRTTAYEDDDHQPTSHPAPVVVVDHSDQLKLELEVQNEGGRLEKLQGALELRRLFGGDVERASDTTFSAYPGGSALLSFDQAIDLEPGTYVLRATVEGADGVKTRSWLVVAD